MAGPGVMELSPSGGARFVLERPSPPARTCLDVDSSVSQQRLWGEGGGQRWEGQ